MATDFFERQAVARRNTKWLVVMFVLAVIAILGSTFVATAVVLGADEFGVLEQSSDSCPDERVELDLVGHDDGERSPERHRVTDRHEVLGNDPRDGLGDRHPYLSALHRGVGLYLHAAGTDGAPALASQCRPHRSPNAGLASNRSTTFS